MIDHRLQLGGLAALRDQDRNIALGGHAEVAVNRFGEVQEGGRRPRRSERRRDLARDMARLAKPADDQLALAAEDQLDCPLELLAQAIGQRVERARLIVQDMSRPNSRTAGVLSPFAVMARALAEPLGAL